MKARRDTMAARIAANWKTLLPGAAVILAIIFAAISDFANRSEQRVTAEGRIERFSFGSGGRTLTPQPIAIVRVADGTTRTIAFNRDQIAHCRAGDRITYTRGPEGVTIDRCAP